MLIILDDDKEFIRSTAMLFKLDIYKRYQKKNIPILPFYSAIDLYRWMVTEGLTIIPQSPFYTVLLADINTPETLDPALQNMQSTPILAWLTDCMKKEQIPLFPIFAVSGDVSPEAFAHIKASGCEGLIRKPVVDISVITDIFVNGYQRFHWQDNPDEFMKSLLIKIMTFTLRTYFNAQQRASKLEITSSDIKIILSDIYSGVYCRDEDKQRRSALIAALGGRELIKQRLLNDLDRMDKRLQSTLISILSGEPIQASRRRKEGQIEDLAERLLILWNE